MNPFKMRPREMDELTQIFHVEHNGSIIGSVHGFFCGSDCPSTIQLVENIDIKNGDWIIDSLTSQRYYACDAKPIVMGGEIIEWMVKYKTSQDYELSVNSNRQTNINIQTVNGNSVIGSQKHVTLNIGSSLNDIENLLHTLPTSDQTSAKELLDELKRIETSTHPVLVEGSLSKFSNLLKKHTDILTAVGGWAVQLLIGK